MELSGEIDTVKLSVFSACRSSIALKVSVAVALVEADGRLQNQEHVIARAFDVANCAGDAVRFGQRFVDRVAQFYEILDGMVAIVDSMASDPIAVAYLDDLDEIRAKVLRCFEAGALATGAHMEIFGSRPPYAQVCHDSAMAALYRLNA